MNFEYTNYIYIYKSDLRKMYKAVKKGIPFQKIFNDIMEGYDDEDYVACDKIYKQVEAEINRRLLQSSKQKILTK